MQEANEMKVDPQSAMNYELALTILPSLMIHYLHETFEVDVEKVVELGTGTHIHKAGIIIVSRKTPVKEIHEYDPRITQEEIVDAPIRVVVHTTPNSLPVGCPTVICHPGFRLTREEIRCLYDINMPSWESTLNAYRPEYIAFSAYSEDEAVADLAWLCKLGYTPRTIHHNPIFREPKFRFSETSGPGWGICLACRS